MSYFKYFPQTIYDNKSVADITRKAKLSKVISDSALDYMSYTIQDGERPEDIAYNYYDDPSLAWLVLMSNDIVDVYSEWPLTTEQVESNIINKYAAKSGTSGTAVLDWAKNATISANIIHYKSAVDDEIKLNRASFIALGNSTTTTGDKIEAGKEYTILELGTTISTANLETLTGLTFTDTFVASNGLTFTAAVDGSIVEDAETITVRGSSLSNPAREFFAVRAYDYELNKNEAKREIQLINKGYISTLKDQLETILTDG